MRKRIILITLAVVTLGLSAWGVKALRDANMNWEPTDWR